MTGETLGRRIYFARVWRERQSLAAFGRAIAEVEPRDTPYSAATISEWEHDRGEPSLKAVVAMSKVSTVRKEWIAFGSGEPLVETYKAQGAA